jgi:hypothetical protein
MSVMAMRYLASGRRVALSTREELPDAPELSR